MSHTSRRSFLKRTAVASAACVGASLGQAPWLRAAGANGDVRIGVVGLGSHVKAGGMGRGEVRHFTKIPGVRVVALCDVDSANLGPEVEKFRGRKEKVAAFADVRKLLENKDVDAVVVNGDLSLDAFGAPTYAMRLNGSVMHGLGDPSRQAALESFRGRTVNAVAGIGNPARFFDVLTRAGMTVVPHAYPDHHRFRPADLPPGTVIMTEKDAVKCAGFRHPDAWVFVVDAEVSGGLEKQVLNKLEIHHG